MAMETASTKAREKQVVVQSERLSKAIEELETVATVLGECLSAIISPHVLSGTDKDAVTPQAALCVHASFLRSKAQAIDKVIVDLNDLINRIEI